MSLWQKTVAGGGGEHPLWLLVSHCGGLGSPRLRGLLIIDVEYLAQFLKSCKLSVRKWCSVFWVPVNKEELRLVQCEYSKSTYLWWEQPGKGC